MEERIFTINLRRGTIKSAKWERSRKSASVVREFLKRHMKSDEVKIGKSITEEIWKHGARNPPAKLRIKAIKDDEGIVKSELLGVVFPVETEKKKEKKEEKKSEKKETK